MVAISLLAINISKDGVPFVNNIIQDKIYPNKWHLFVTSSFVEQYGCGWVKVRVWVWM
jgi:hypothetical protein